MIKFIEENKITYAKIIKASEMPDFDGYFTDEKDEIQFGLVNYEKNYKTGAHFHNKILDKTRSTDEIIVMLDGSCRLDFYNIKGSYIKSVELSKGDIAILYKGAHNVLFYEDTRAFVVRSGAFDKDESDTRIIGINNSELNIDKD